eukprot:4518908-Prymnesium_polylepis.2
MGHVVSDGARPHLWGGARRGRGRIGQSEEGWPRPDWARGRIFEWRAHLGELDGIEIGGQPDERLDLRWHLRLERFAGVDRQVLQQAVHGAEHRLLVGATSGAAL